MHASIVITTQCNQIWCCLAVTALSSHGLVWGHIHGSTKLSGKDTVTWGYCFLVSGEQEGRSPDPSYSYTVLLPYAGAVQTPHPFF